MGTIKEILFSTVLICILSSIVLADEPSTNQSPLQEILDIFNPNRGTEPKVFDVNNGEAQVRINWHLKTLNYQLIYIIVPYKLMNYTRNPLQEPSNGAVTIFFLNKDGWKITERPCYLVDFVYDKDEKALICKNSIEALTKHSDIDEYRRITSASVLIN